MTLLYDLIYLLAVGLGWPFLLIRRLRRGPGSVSLGERMGRVPSRSVSAHCVWLHGVSLGEINAVRTIVAELRWRTPETVIVISSTTQTGLARARELYPELIVFRFPLDFSFVLRRVFSRLRPSVIVLMELEAWPNLLEVAAQASVPVIIANGRVTEGKSMRRFSMPIVRWVARRMFGKLAWVGAQDQVYADRFRQLGACESRIEVTGSVKYDTAEIEDRVDGQDELAAEMVIDVGKPLLVCGSTGPGEEALILDAYQSLLKQPANSRLQLAIVPRKPERFDEVADLILSRGFACLRRSGKPPRLPPGVSDPRAVFLGDTMGELRKFYSLATVVFVGRSLVPMGGSDVIEAAALGKPVLVGPYHENFAEPVRLLLENAGCMVVSDARALASAVSQQLSDAPKRGLMSTRARETIQRQRGATTRTIDRILTLLGVR
jgi:3-deoxy-D-manno-octulosonic-acid transferase